MLWKLNYILQTYYIVSAVGEILAQRAYQLIEDEDED